MLSYRNKIPGINFALELYFPSGSIRSKLSNESKKIALKYFLQLYSAYWDVGKTKKTADKGQLPSAIPLNYLLGGASPDWNISDPCMLL